LKGRADRYELAYMRDSGRVITSANQHHAILGALKTGVTEKAVRLLEDNWRVSLDFLLPWLRHRPEAAR
jgi:DNA-binding GntR family transcriptional regulator